MHRHEGAGAGRMAIPVRGARFSVRSAGRTWRYRCIRPLDRCPALTDALLGRRALALLEAATQSAEHGDARTAIAGEAR